MSNTQVMIQRQDPNIEAYRLGLLRDVQGFTRNQIFGQNVQALRAQGLSDDQIAQRLSVPGQGTEGQEGYIAPISYSAEDVGGVSQDAAFGPPGYQVAQLSPAEQAAVTAAQQGIGGYTPFLSSGSQMVGQGQNLLAGNAAPAFQQGIASLAGTGEQFSPFQTFAYMNPFEQAVIDQSMQDIARQGRIAQQGVRSQAVGAGAFGGSRTAIAEQELQRNILDQQARTAAQLRASGFTQAQDTARQAFEAAQARRQQGANIFGSLGSGIGSLGAQLGQLGIQQAGIGELQSRLGTGDIQNLLTTGATERGVTQATADALRLTNLQRYSQPYQQYGFLSDIYSGVPTGQMTTTASSAPQVSPFQTAIGLGIQGLSAAAGAQRAGII
jgi:hypothetical protein